MSRKPFGKSLSIAAEVTNIFTWLEMPFVDSWWEMGWKAALNKFKCDSYQMNNREFVPMLLSPPLFSLFLLCGVYCFYFSFFSNNTRYAKDYFTEEKKNVVLIFLGGNWQKEHNFKSHRKWGCKNMRRRRSFHLCLSVPLMSSFLILSTLVLPKENLFLDSLAQVLEVLHRRDLCSL